MTEDAIFCVCPPPKKVVRKNSEDVGDEILGEEWNPSRHFFGDLAKSQFCKKLGSEGVATLSRTVEPAEEDEVCRFKDHVFQNQDTSSISWGGFLKDPRNIRDISMFESPLDRCFGVHLSEAFLIKNLH